MLLGTVIDASDAFGVSRKSSPDTPKLIYLMLLGCVIHAPDAFTISSGLRLHSHACCGFSIFSR
ncbi:hypothetical protein M405DRAFT_865287 [Rhizopogon salebrosus TDB-379]|nr:hypothetical protein M405DRAFT_865287 [Rhizopogon salebrosus TDB-379]